MSAGDLGPVLFAYDGSELAGLAIDEAARQLAGGRDAIVLTVWRPFVVGFIPPPGVEFDAAASDEVKKSCRANRRARSLAGTSRWLPRRESRAHRSANVEGDRSSRRRPRREPDRARLPRQEWSRRRFPRQRGGRRRGALGTYRADRAQARLNHNALASVRWSSAGCWRFGDQAVTRLPSPVPSRAGLRET